MRYGVTVPPAPVRSITDHLAPQPGGPEEEEDLRRRELLYGEPPDTIEQDTNYLLQSIHDWSRYNNKLILIEGAGRVGKTTIARKVYEHPSVASSFDHAVWIDNGGLNWEYFELRWEILQQIQLQRGMANLSQSDDELDFSELLSVKRILIVVDAINDNDAKGMTNAGLLSGRLNKKKILISLDLVDKRHDVQRGDANFRRLTSGEETDLYQKEREAPDA
jgi:hypothetical protein